MNFVFDSDSYKYSHWPQYPPNTQALFSYLESRGGRYDKTVFYGLQYIMKKYLTSRITPEMVIEAKDFLEAHGEPFNFEGWMYIAKELEGKLPIRIRAVPEGMVVPNHNVIMSGESTDPKVFWFASWLETVLMRIWYPITVCTQSWHIRQMILDYLEKTADDPQSEINFKLHDFGSRGVSSQESAMIGGAAHLVNFMGSDTVAGVWCANKYYNCEMAGFSIPAAEHSTMTVWGRSRERDAYENMLKIYGKQPMFACVSDSYDIYNACGNIWGTDLYQKVVDAGAVVIIRPDSGDPPEVVLKCLEILGSKFGFTQNSKDYKILNHVRVIQGDGINEDSIKKICDTFIKNGWSASNVAFGMGGALLQQVNRDTQKFAYKCSWAEVAGKGVDVYKEPITDPGKNSKAGRLDLVNTGGKRETCRMTHPWQSLMRPVFENGEILVEEDLDTIRARAIEEAKLTI
jgi:nicotinamide phosphoribosyltransferase